MECSFGPKIRFELVDGSCIMNTSGSVLATCELTNERRRYRRLMWRVASFHSHLVSDWLGFLFLQNQLVAKRCQPAAGSLGVVSVS